MCLPLFHTFAAPIGLVLPLRLGITTYFLPRFHIHSFTSAIRTFQITDVAVVPPIITALLQLAPDERCLKSIRYVLCGGAPIAAAVQRKLYQYLHPQAIVGQVWGATELGWVAMFGPGEKDDSGSIGRLLPGVALKLINEDRQVSDELELGEALVRSPTVFQGYLQNDKDTASAFDNEGFCRTGDRIYIQDNKLYLNGRIKDTMKVNGWQVAPTEIENVLLQHPRIADVAVVGVPGISEGGLAVTRPRAYVVGRPSIEPSSGERLTEDTVKAYVASCLVSYKRLTGGVVFVEKIPRTPTGKTLRRLLLEEDGIVN